MTRTKPAEELESLPNIGPQAARWLKRVGIHSATELRRVGSVEAAARIRELRPDDPPCRSMLCGLEGAIRGVRWHALPAGQRETLWQAYVSRCDAD